MAIYKKDSEGRIWVYRNKRKPVAVVKEKLKSEDGCLSCDLFDYCLWLHSADISICQGMEMAGMVEPEDDIYSSRYFKKV